MKMKEEIAMEKSKMSEGKEDLSQTIAELEQFDFDLSINGKSPDNKNDQLKPEAPEQKESTDSNTNLGQIASDVMATDVESEVKQGVDSNINLGKSDATIDDKSPDGKANDTAPELREGADSDVNLGQADTKVAEPEQKDLYDTNVNSGEADPQVSAGNNISGDDTDVSKAPPEKQDDLKEGTENVAGESTNVDTKDIVNDESKDSVIETPEDNVTNDGSPGVMVEHDTEDIAIVPMPVESHSNDIAKENLGQPSENPEMMNGNVELVSGDGNPEASAVEVDLNQNVVPSPKVANTEVTNNNLSDEILHSEPVTA